NNRIEQILLDKIDSIFNELDFSEYGENLFDIISDLISISSKYAIEILNKNKDDSDHHSNINNLLFTRISMASLTNSKDEKEEKFTEILEKVGNNESRAINASLQILVGAYSSDKILKEINHYD